MNDPKIEKILAAVDFSEMTEAVIGHARFLARAFDAELKLLHVVSVPPLSEATTWLTPVISASLEDDIRGQIMKGVEEKLGEISTSCGEDCRGVEAIIREGVPFEKIIETANELDIDLIVVGTHGRHGVRLLLGSTANAILHGTPCDVHAVRIRS